MAFVTSLIKTQLRGLHDTAIKTMAKWDPESVGAAQLEEWNTQAAELASTAAKAATDATTAATALKTIEDNVARYTQAAEKLAEKGNTKAAEQAVDTALEWKGRVADAKTEVAESEAWAKETREAAERAQRLVMEGRTKIEKAKRDQYRAIQAAENATQRLRDRERMAGIGTGIAGTDVAVNAMAANTVAAKQKADAANKIGRAHV